MNVVQGQDAANFGGGGRDGFGFEAAGSALHEDRAGLAQDGERARDDQACDGKRDERVDATPGAEGDGGAGDDDRDGAERIGHGFEGSATDVEVIVRMAMEETEDEEVDRETGDADHDDRAGVQFRSIAGEAAGRLEEDVTSDRGKESDMERD